MKKIIIIILIFVIIVVGAVFYNRAKTIKQITNVNLDDVAYIESETNLGLEEFVNEYKEAKFKKCKEYHMGKVANYSVDCYDEQNKRILKIIVGNDYQFIVSEYDTKCLPIRYKKVN